MIALNLIVAPLLRFTVYRADRKELICDIVVIAVLQIVALSYGLYIVEAGRPAYIAFEKEIKTEEFAVKEYQMRVPAIFRTDSYESFETAANIIQTKAKPLSKLTNSNDKLKVEAVLRHYPDGWLTLVEPLLDMVVLTDKEGHVIDILDLRPNCTSRLSEVL
ncbi:MAG TPA: hypothetical protein DCX43_00715 [Psychrobacter sp.]|nr:hypothetical protein [Psychrobacter sp.]